MNIKIWSRFHYLFRKYSDTLFIILLRLVTLIVFISVFYAIQRYLPPSTPLSELENSIQLLSQILAIIVGILLIGVTVNLSFYNDSDELNKNQEKITLATKKESYLTLLEDKFTNYYFLQAILKRPGITKFYFIDETHPKELYFIYRPFWDGVWYQMEYSPFSQVQCTEEKSVQIRRVHEVAICANSVIHVINNMRASKCTLITQTSGTNGSRKFIKVFEEYASRGIKLLPTDDIDHIVETVYLALSSIHYMFEELNAQSDNLHWSPFSLSKFQLIFCDYIKELTFLIEKLQLLRVVNACDRFKDINTKLKQKTVDKLFLKEIYQMRSEINAIRKKVITIHGAANYFHIIKKTSTLGIGIALIVLIALLISWPFLRATEDISIRIFGFAILYSSGIAALVESTYFLIQLLKRNRT